MTKSDIKAGMNVYRELPTHFFLSSAFALPLIRSLVALALCLEVCFPTDAISINEAVAPRRFVDWCLNQAKLPSQTRHTVAVLLQTARTQDCKQADNGVMPKYV